MRNNHYTTAEKHSNGQLTISSGNELQIIQQGNTTLVDARELHKLLRVRNKFYDWITYRIKEYGFETDKDFFVTEISVAKTKRNDYLITLDMAKELAMLERNEVGRTWRRYFIEMEKKARQLAVPAERDLLRGLPKTHVGDMVVYGFLEVLERCGLSTKNAHWRRRRYPQHFLTIGEKVYISIWYATYMYKSCILKNSRIALINNQLNLIN